MQVFRKKHAGHSKISHERMPRTGCSLVLIAEAGGIALILAELDNHAKHAGVVENACWALCNIGWSEKALLQKSKGER